MPIVEPYGDIRFAPIHRYSTPHLNNVPHEKVRNVYSWLQRFLKSHCQKRKCRP